MSTMHYKLSPWSSASAALQFYIRYSVQYLSGSSQKTAHLDLHPGPYSPLHHRLPIYLCKVKQYNVFSLCLNVLNRASSKLQSEEPNTMIPLLPLSLPEGTDHDNEDNTIRRAFDIFAKTVKPKEWTRFMRSLRLSDTDIQDAELTFPMNFYEQRYNMLTTWREQTGSNNVNTLLQNLYSLNMRRTANDIIKKLIQEQLYVSNT
ncbi:uncharacterized protein LOC128663586 [Bombina bombina]|uniref:uncharacterized protein LOC128663586 n=1 Tax=Bombina bombina TaxID=8345 RepID=UPI00235A4DB4|nr:uncharacterized protein LOC128663586 [Bombina bombina]